MLLPFPKKIGSIAIPNNPSRFFTGSTTLMTHSFMNRPVSLWMMVNQMVEFSARVLRDSLYFVGRGDGSDSYPSHYTSIAAERKKVI
jgi:hypothetical protein